MTSSLMPTVKWFFGFGLASFVEDGLDHRRRELLGGEAVAAADDPRHGLNGACPAATASASAVTTSWYSGSPAAPGSLVRSSTAIVLTVAGSASTKCSTANGR